MFKISNKFRWVKNRLLAILCLIFLLSGQLVNAATNYLAPSSGSFEIGSTLSTNVYIDAKGQAINSSEGTINFPKDLLEVVSLSKSGSIFTLWVEEPSFSNSQGVISYVGGLPAPGYTGATGKVLTINFKIKKAGEAKISFSGSAIRASDGLGTNVLSGSGQGNFTLIDKKSAPEPDKEAPKEAPKAEVDKKDTDLLINLSISSATHSDQNKWYSNANPSFSWALPAGVEQVKLLYDQSPSSVPTQLYTTPINSKVLTSQPDGKYYLHLQLKNKNGWGSVNSFAVNIDTTKPTDLAVTESGDSQKAQSAKVFKISAQDALSGIDYYELIIDDQAPVKWIDDGSGLYETDSLAAGDHVLTVKAFDKAGNYITSSSNFKVLSSELSQEPVSALTVTKSSALPGSLVLVLSLIMLLFLFISLAWYAWHRAKVLEASGAVSSKRVAKKDVEATLELVRKSTWKQIELLHGIKNKRALTSEENAILKELKKNIGKIESVLSK